MSTMTGRSTPATAQDRYGVLMREHLAPGLRSLGLKGSGGTFAIPDDLHWALVGFQRSQFSDRTHLRFTLNLTVGSKASWNEARAERSYLHDSPAPNTFYGSWIWQKRIGGLMPSGEDKWWRLDGSTDLQALADDVIGAMRDYGLPAMHARLASRSSDTPAR